MGRYDELLAKTIKGKRPNSPAAEEFGNQVGAELYGPGAVKRRQGVIEKGLRTPTTELLEKSLKTPLDNTSGLGVRPDGRQENTSGRGVHSDGSKPAKQLHCTCGKPNGRCICKAGSKKRQFSEAKIEKSLGEPVATIDGYEIYELKDKKSSMLKSLQDLEALVARQHTVVEETPEQELDRLKRENRILKNIIEHKKAHKPKS